MPFNQREYFRQRYKSRHQDAVNYLGGQCKRCGTIKDLEFDHVDPKTKSFDLGKRLQGAPWAELLHELDKCQLLVSLATRRKLSKKKTGEVKATLLSRQTNGNMVHSGPSSAEGEAAVATNVLNSIKSEMLRGERGRMLENNHLNLYMEQELGTLKKREEA